jgi:hypothetical protein
MSPTCRPTSCNDHSQTPYHTLVHGGWPSWPTAAVLFSYGCIFSQNRKNNIKKLGPAQYARASLRQRMQPIMSVGLYSIHHKRVSGGGGGGMPTGARESRRRPPGIDDSCLWCHGERRPGGTARRAAAEKEDPERRRASPATDARERGTHGRSAASSCVDYSSILG